MIEFQDVSKAFGSKQVLKGVSFAVPDARTSVVIGPSGCGKSTTLRLLLRLIEADSGAVRVDGQDIGAFSREELFDYRRTVGIVFQSAALFDSLRVWENVGFPLLEGGQSKLSPDRVRKIAEEKLAIVDLAGTADL